MLTRNSKGFTIVELLIVVVVIGILAAISIVAYNGISKRAIQSSVQSELSSAMKQLENDKTTNGDKYPVSLGAADSGRGIKSSSGSVLQYSVVNTTNPATFCLSEANGLVAYYVTQSSTPKEGLCPGDSGSTDPNVIVNLVTNPSFESNVDGLITSYATGGAGQLTSDTAQKFVGQSSAKATWTTASTSTVASIHSSAAPIQTAVYGSGNYTYTVSTYVRSNKAQTVRFQLRGYTDSDGMQLYTTSVGPAGVSVPANTWQKVTATISLINMPNDPPIQSVRAMVQYTASANYAVGDSIQLDGVMITKGSTSYNYADGTSPGWEWNGTPNNSASRGPTI
jgi:prepilin-type N-terminal cleavage/methylation domain-containing protein